MKKKLEKNSIITITLYVASVLSLLIGIIGYKQYYHQLGESISLDDALYNSLQLFFFSANFSNTDLPLTLNIARFLAPLTLATAIVQQLIFATSKKKDALIVQFQYRNHYVIAGLGMVGYKIALDCIAKKKQVVAIEINPGNVHITELQHKGVIVFTGDATNEFLINKAGVANAKVLYAVTEKDAVNIEISRVVKKVVLSKRRKNNHLMCLVHVSEISALKLFESSKLCNPDPLEVQDGLKIHPFNINQIAAREVIMDFPPDKYDDRAYKQGDTTVHILIIGLGNLGENLLVNFARKGHYLCNIPYNQDDARFNRRNVVHIVDTNAAQRLKEIKVLYPRIDDVIDIRNHDLTTMTFDVGSFTEILQTYRISIVYLCLENDFERFTITQMIEYHNRENTHTIVNLLPMNCNCEVLADEECNLFQTLGVNTYDIIGETCKIYKTDHEKHDHVAKILHSFSDKIYAELYKKPEHAETVMDVSTIDQNWKSASESFKQSSRDSAEHFFIKIRTLGLDPDQAQADFIKDRISKNKMAEHLEQVEHIRFVAERLLAGWVSPNEKQQKALQELKDAGEKTALAKMEAELKKIKVNTTLIPYVKLSDEKKTFNKAYISQMHEILDLIKKNNP